MKEVQTHFTVMFSQQFSIHFFLHPETRDTEADIDKKPQCSCVVYSGILLTWDPLVGFEGLGGRDGGWRMHNRTESEKRGKAWAQKSVREIQRC